MKKFFVAILAVTLCTINLPTAALAAPDTNNTDLADDGSSDSQNENTSSMPDGSDSSPENDSSSESLTSAEQTEADSLSEELSQTEESSDEKVLGDEQLQETNEPLTEIETYTDGEAYALAISDLASADDPNYDSTLEINLNTETVTDEDGTTTDEYDSAVQEVLEEDTSPAEAAASLDANAYTVCDQSADSVTVIDKYQTQRLILRDDSFEGSSRASRILNHDNEYILQYDSEEDAIADFELLSAEGYDYLSPDYTFTLTDGDVSEETDEINTQSVSVSSYLSWGPEKMGLDFMQDKLSAYSLRSSVIVAVIDSGVDYNHSFLQGRILPGCDVGDDDDDPMDDSTKSSVYGHGTHVAGIIVSSTTSDVSILPVKLFNTKGNASFIQLKAALEYAISNNVDVINLSLGQNNLTEQQKAEMQTYIEPLLKQATQNGIIPCIASGNTGQSTDTMYPACTSYGITVSALNSDLSLASYSCTGDAVDFCAPGTNIYSTLPGNRFGNMSGTSMAAPFVASAVAMIKSWDKSLSFDDTLKLLKLYVNDYGDTGWDSSYGYGLINLSNFNGWAPDTTYRRTSTTDGHITLSENGGKWNGKYYYLSDGTLVNNTFFCDGTYTYYLQYDGTPMKKRLTYHPDGVHIIYLDEDGHEVFNNFKKITESISRTQVNDLCYFNVYGYMFTDVLTYGSGVNSTKLYYANPYGVMECNGWFYFSNGALGYAETDGTLMTSQYTYHNNQYVYIEGDGHVRGTGTGSLKIGE